MYKRYKLLFSKEFKIFKYYFTFEITKPLPYTEAEIKEQKDLEDSKKGKIEVITIKYVNAL